MTFKGKAEHNINNADAEILVHCESETGTKAIVSFLLEVDTESEHPN
jgi:hypothetical protein